MLCDGSGSNSGSGDSDSDKVSKSSTESMLVSLSDSYLLLDSISVNASRLSSYPT